MRGVYFVYKFRVKKTGHFYVGVTTDIDRRKTGHCSGINTAIKSIIFGRKIRKGGLSVGYFQMAEKILTVCSFDHPSDVKARDMLAFTVIDVLDTPEQAAELEAKLIRRYINRPNFINIQEKSFYRHPVKKDRPYKRHLKILKVYGY